MLGVTSHIDRKGSDDKLQNIRQTLCFSEPWRPIFSMLPLIRVQVPYHVPHALTYKAASVARHESIAKPWEPVEMHLAYPIKVASQKLSIHLNESSLILTFVFPWMNNDCQGVSCLPPATNNISKEDNEHFCESVILKLQAFGAVGACYEQL